MLIRSKGQIIKDEIVTHGLLIFFSLIMIFPVALSLMTSFKTKTDVMIFMAFTLIFFIFNGAYLMMANLPVFSPIPGACT